MALEELVFCEFFHVIGRIWVVVAKDGTAWTVLLVVAQIVVRSSRLMEGSPWRRTSVGRFACLGDAST